MQCPKCGKRWSVKNTAPSNDPSRNHLRKRVSDFYDWYTQDYVVRIRFCGICTYSSITVEFEVKDVNEMMTISAKEGLPDSYIKNKKKV